MNGPLPAGHAVVTLTIIELAVEISNARGVDSPHRRSPHMTRSSVAGVVPALALLLIVHTAFAPVAHAQFGRFATKTALCLGSAVGGFYLGDKIGSLAIARMKLSGEEAARTKLAFKIGTAAALCGTSVIIANTVYNKLSKRDQEARAREMDAALADAGSTPRSYVLPDSKLM